VTPGSRARWEASAPPGHAGRHGPARCRVEWKQHFRAGEPRAALNGKPVSLARRIADPLAEWRSDWHRSQGFAGFSLFVWARLNPGSAARVFLGKFQARKSVHFPDLGEAANKGGGGAFFAFCVITGGVCNDRPQTCASYNALLTYICIYKYIYALDKLRVRAHTHRTRF
jgi:hypothetical protein